MVWAAIDLHAWAVATLVTGVLSAAASLIAILAFQNYNEHETFQFNVNEVGGVANLSCPVIFGITWTAALNCSALPRGRR